MSVHCPDCGAVASYGHELGHRSDCPSQVVGHKTFSTGDICPETGFPALRHEPLTRGEADAMWQRAEMAKAKRETEMPDEKSAISHMWNGWYRLKELGWREAIYCPKDGTHFQVIEAGSTGIHDCNYQGEWPTGTWWLYDGDVWPSRPILFKLYPADQAVYDAQMKAASERIKSMLAAGEPRTAAWSLD